MLALYEGVGTRIPRQITVHKMHVELVGPKAQTTIEERSRAGM